MLKKTALVLIADDYDDAAPMMAALVEHETPYEAIWAKDGKDALDLALQCRPDAAILDIHMPHIGGIELAHALRVAFPSHVPVLIAATAGAVDEAVQSGMFDAVLRKPVDLATLIDLLRRLIPDQNTSSGW
jgi:CheY-like chemotaxis protein